MLLTVKELANELRLPVTTVEDRRWRSRVGLQAIRVGGRVFFDTVDVAELLRRGKEELPAVPKCDGQVVNEEV
jgi:hypothetical protein